MYMTGSTTANILLPPVPTKAKNGISVPCAELNTMTSFLLWTITGSVTEAALRTALMTAANGISAPDAERNMLKFFLPSDMIGQKYIIALPAA